MSNRMSENVIDPNDEMFREMEKGHGGLMSAISFIEKNDVFFVDFVRCKIFDFLGINESILTPIF